MVTLKEVAAAAQVSTVTASSVLSGVNRVRVSPATAERIRQIAKDMNYVPLAAARGLRTGRTRIIAFVATSENRNRCDTVWHEALRGVSDLMWEREERLMLVMPRHRDHELEMIRQMAYGRQVDGFIIQDSGADQERMEMLVGSARPFVIMGGVPAPGVNSVSFDMQAFARDTGTALQAEGCTSVVSILPWMGGDPLERIFSVELEKWAAANAMRCSQWHGAFIPDLDWLKQKREEAANGRVGVLLARGLLPETIRLLEDADMPLGVASSMVYVTMGEDLLMLPDGLSVMHFDNYTLGRRSARLLAKLVDNMKEPPLPENILVPAARLI